MPSYRGTSQVIARYRGANEIIKRYRGANVAWMKAPPTQGLVGWWKMSEGSGTSIADSSGSGITAVATGCDWQDGRFGASGAKALRLYDTVPSYVTVPRSGILSDNPSSMSIWLYGMNRADASPSFVIDAGILGGAGTNKGLTLRLESSVAPTFIVADGAGNRVTISYSTPILNVWTHLCSTFSGSVCVFYVNGSIVASSNVVGYTPDTASSITLGFGATHSSINALMSDFRYYNRALSGAEVSAIYMSEKP